VKTFVLYTAARAGIFLACWGAIWLVIGWWVEWDSVNALSTALLALIISSVIALTRLKGLRERFAADVAVRAERAAAAFNARRAAEDEEEDARSVQAGRPPGTDGSPASHVDGSASGQQVADAGPTRHAGGSEPGRAGASPSAHGSDRQPHGEA
jgi:hypothetical protein